MEDTDRIISPEEFAERMRKCNSLDTESGHIEADALMCETLRRLGYSEGIATFKSFSKWYS